MSTLLVNDLIVSTKDESQEHGGKRDGTHEEDTDAAPSAAGLDHSEPLKFRDAFCALR